MPVGLVLLRDAGEATLGYVMAGTVLGTLVLMAADVRLPVSGVTTWATGLGSGVLLTSTGMNGPPLVLGISAHRLPPRVYRGTLQVVLCVQDLAAVAGFVVVGGVDHRAALLAAVGVVVSPCGWLAGDRLFARIPPEHFRRVLVAGLTVSAVLLVLKP